LQIGGGELKDKFYYLNKILHSVDIYAEVELPPVFFFEHPLGLVLGRAEYGNNFFAMQGCTVGGNKGKYPIIGENVKMYSNSKIVGNSKIGNNVWLSANVYVKDTDIPDNSIVFGSSPYLIIKDLMK
jgi:serine O-acetyltransferase